MKDLKKLNLLRNWIKGPVRLALVVGILGVGFIPQAAFAQQPTAETISRGNVGVFSPGGFDENTFFVTRVEKRSVGYQPVNFIRPLVEIESPGRNFPNVLTYVFFNVRPGSIEKQDDRDKGVGIWFRPTGGGAWEQCTNTMIVDDRVASQMGMDLTLQGHGEEVRIACIATRYNAVYGVGVLRDSARTMQSQ
jgi:hypothetical protein